MRTSEKIATLDVEYIGGVGYCGPDWREAERVEQSSRSDECSTCSGTGEGHRPGRACHACRGTGDERVYSEDAEYDRQYWNSDED